MPTVIEEYPEYTLEDFTRGEDLVILNRSDLPDPLILEIATKSNWRTLVEVHGDVRDAKLILEAITNYTKVKDRLYKVENSAKA